MSTQRDDDDFDRWVAEKGGPEAVVAMIDDMKRRVADGSLPGFRDKEALLAACVRMESPGTNTPGVLSEGLYGDPVRCGSS